MENVRIVAMQKKLEECGLFPLSRQSETAQKVLEERLNRLIPVAMKEAKAECWLVISREYCEDPVFRSLVAWDMPNSHRLNMLIFIRKEGRELKRYSIGGLSEQSASLYETLNEPGRSEWEILSELLQKEAPESIAVNKSLNSALADGLTLTLAEELKRSIPDQFTSRICSAERIVIAYMQRLTNYEIALMKQIVSVTHDIINYAFSKEVIRANETTTTDLEWLMRDIMGKLDMDFWFGPDIDLQRQGSKVSRMFRESIREGDLLHCDVGFKPRFINLHSDVQRLCYVLKQNEQDAPDGIKNVLKSGNRFQDIVMGEMDIDKTGNEIYLQALGKAKEDSLKPMLYTHPLGTYGHGAGPCIGQYGQERTIPGRGDFLVKENTCYALELNCLTAVPEWEGQEVFAYLEEDICFTNTSFYLNKRQTELLLV